MCVLVLCALLVAIHGGMDWTRFVRALDLAGVRMKAAAIYMGISPPQLARQIRGQEHMHVDRMANLPADFHRWFALLTLEDMGLPVEVTRAAAVEGAVASRRQLRMAVEPETARRTA